MRHGTIQCECGQEFYFESIFLRINCLNCGKEHDISKFPFLEEENVEDGPEET